MNGQCPCGARLGPTRRAGYFGRRGLCARCYRRWLDHGKPAGGAPPAQRPGRRPGGGRREDYEFLRGIGLTREEAAMRLGVTVRQALRYEAELRNREQAAA